MDDAYIGRAARSAARYAGASEARRDAIAERWSGDIYFCVECDEACRAPGTYTKCSDFPRQHDETGYRGTGTDYPEAVRLLARLIAAD
jgi:hypothetical protein